MRFTWRSDLAAILVGSTAVVVLLYAAAGAVVFWKAATCSRQCEVEGNLRIPALADRLNWIRK